jgi:protein-S-isoprenylcysteine O-methyltransferase Ste14
MRSSLCNHLWRNRLGFLFFGVATGLSILATLEHPSLLAALATAHNALLAVIYLRRYPSVRYDRKGLVLGLLAAVLPTATPLPDSPVILLTLTALSGYILILWSLQTLGRSFGIAPADRGLVTSGPYKLVRHPMYLGELLLRGALVAAVPDLLPALGLGLCLAAIQVLRILREEKLIQGYPAYAGQVRFRLIPGVW